MFSPVADRALGLTLKPWRLLNRIKQSAVAADLGVSQATVSRWENLAQTAEHKQLLD